MVNKTITSITHTHEYGNTKEIYTVLYSDNTSFVGDYYELKNEEKLFMNINIFFSETKKYKDRIETIFRRSDFQWQEVQGEKYKKGN